MSKVHFLLALHDHQPVGNFDVVFHRACNDAYGPFLDELQRHPQVRMALHYSGSLLEWIEHNRPDMIDRMREMVKAGQLEIMGGAYYEPILTMLPQRDLIGQVRMYVDHLQELFQTRVRGLWLPERIWEQRLASSIAQAGIDYLIVDDTHFKYAGLSQEQLTGYFMTEDEGKLLRVFAGSEQLRYHIPFADPWKTTEYLGQLNAAAPGSLVVYADDGEKFGVWPETHKHVYTNGWLRRWFEELERNLHWIEFITFSEAIDKFPPRGKVYLPDASYREMTEWALPAKTLVEYEDVVLELQNRGLFDRVKRYMRGGFWRNFKMKYPESNQMYGKMMHVSRKVDSIKADGQAYEDARRELYRGQCNCSWWHGVFGGLYLPHLRHAIYEHLIAADCIADATHGRGMLQAEELDFDMDAANEVYLANDYLTAVIKPDRGGHMTELDVRGKNVNLLAGLSRRFEAYHRNVTNPPPEAAPGDVKSIHHIVKSKEEGLGKLLKYDWYLREGFIDHFLLPDVTIEQMMDCEYIERGEFVTGPFDCRVKRNAKSVRVDLSRNSTVWVGNTPFAVKIEKSYKLVKDKPEIDCTYKITSASAPVDIIFAPEVNMAFVGKDPDVWNYRLENGESAGELEALHTLEKQDEIGVRDKMKGMDVLLRFSSPADVWLFPIRTVSQSEGGFEHVFQSSAIVARWQVHLEPGQPWQVNITEAVRDL